MIRIFKTSLSASSSDSPEVLTAESGQQAPPGRRGAGPKSPGRRSPGGGASLLSGKRLALPFLALVAVLAASLLFLLPGGPLHADGHTVDYPENGEDPVAMFSATDPEGMPITWDILASDAAETPTDINPSTDSVDATHFAIKDGVLTFDVGGDEDNPDTSVSPDFEAPRAAVVSDENTNTYNVVVVAMDTSTDEKLGYRKLTVNVTNVSERGEVSWTVDPDGAGDLMVADVNGGEPILQFQPGAMIMASIEDGDVSGATKAVADSAIQTWRWYRSDSKDSLGTLITGSGADTATYTVQDESGDSDVGMYLHVRVVYTVGTGSPEAAQALVSPFPVLVFQEDNTLPSFDDTTLARSVNEGDKGMTVGDPVTADDPDPGALNYTLSTADDNMPKNAATDGEDAFKIDQTTGQITTNADLDYETISGAFAGWTVVDGKLTATVNVRVTDSAGTATGGSEAGDPADATVTITLMNVNDPPMFVVETPDDGVKSPVGIKMVPENSNKLYGLPADGYSEADDSGVTYKVTDPEVDDIAFTLMGPDAARFHLDTTNGLLSFKKNPEYKPDFENPGDANRDNLYELTIRASDGKLHADRMVRVRVTDIPDETPALATSGGSTSGGTTTVSYPENSTAPVATFTSAASVTWSLLASDAATTDITDIADTDRVDEDHFAISKTGVLTFNEPPDFEAPSGEGTSNTNTYRVVVRASISAGGTAYRKVVVNVTDVTDVTGKVSWTVNPNGEDTSPNADILDTANTPIHQFQIGALITASLENTGGDADTGSTTWTWYRSSSPTSLGSPIIPTGTPINPATNVYTVQDTTGNSDLNRYVHVRVVYTVNGASRSAQLLSKFPVQLMLGETNSTPSFADTTLERSVKEGKAGTPVGAPVRATDSNSGTRLNYTLAGTDMAHFKIDQETGQITIGDNGLDYEETDLTVDDQCAVANECVVTVRATDSAGAATGGSVTGDPADATVTITITNDDEKPMFTTGTAEEDIKSPLAIVSPENRKELFQGTEPPPGTENAAVDVTYAATDPDKTNAVDLSLMGPDAALFTISQAGVLSFNAKPDYEMPLDANKDNRYQLTVRATEEAPGSLYADHMVTVRVTPVDEAPVVMRGGLLISGPSGIDCAEPVGMVGNCTAAVATYTLSGPNKDMATWTLSGPDALDFMRIGSDGMLRFSSAPDFEMPADADMDNRYMVTLKANDGENMAEREVTVTVTNMEEEGTVTLSPMTAVVDTELTATLDDPDGGETGESWQWKRSMTMGGPFEDIPGATSASYTPVDTDDRYYLMATVTYTDGYGEDDDMAESGAVMVSATPADPNAALIARYDTNPQNGMIDRSEVIAAIRDYLDGEVDAPSRADVIQLIRLYLDG